MLGKKRARASFYKVALAFVGFMREIIPELTDEERLVVFDKVVDGYCPYCGSAKTPCTCQQNTND